MGIAMIYRLFKEWSKEHLAFVRILITVNTEFIIIYNTELEPL